MALYKCIYYHLLNLKLRRYSMLKNLFTILLLDAQVLLAHCSCDGICCVTNCMLLLSSGAYIPIKSNEAQLPLHYSPLPSFNSQCTLMRYWPYCCSLAPSYRVVNLNQSIIYMCTDAFNGRKESNIDFFWWWFLLCDHSFRWNVTG